MSGRKFTLTSLGGLVGLGFAAAATFVASQLLPFEAVISPVVVVIEFTSSAFYRRTKLPN